MASALLLFILLCVNVGAWALASAFKEASNYKTPKEPKWITYKDENGRIKTYKTRWAEQ